MNKRWFHTRWIREILGLHSCENIIPNKVVSSMGLKLLFNCFLKENKCSTYWRNKRSIKLWIIHENNVILIELKTRK